MNREGCFKGDQGRSEWVILSNILVDIHDSEEVKIPFPLTWGTPGNQRTPRVPTFFLFFFFPIPFLYLEDKMNVGCAMVEAENAVGIKVN